MDLNPPSEMLPDWSKVSAKVSFLCRKGGHERRQIKNRKGKKEEESRDRLSTEARSERDDDIAWLRQRTSGCAKRLEERL